MAKFIFNDFTTNQLQDSMILSSKRAFEIVKAMHQDQITPQQADLVCGTNETDTVYFWLLQVKAQEQMLSIILPIFIPQNENEAAALLDKCYSYLQKEPCFYCQNQSFLLIQGKYYGQLFFDEQGNSEIKIFTLWASQKIVQDYFSWALQETVGAMLVKLTFNSFNTQIRHFDVAWMMLHGDEIEFLSIDACCKIDIPMFNPEWEELSIGSFFKLNGQKYIIDEDAENGQFLAKVCASSPKVRPS